MLPLPPATPTALLFAYAFLSNVALAVVPPRTTGPPRHLTTTSPEGYLLKHEAVRPI